MKQIDKILYNGRLPESFFTIPVNIYAGLSFSLRESSSLIEKICEKEAEKTGITVYTDHKNIRLAGLFPEGTDQCFFGYWETAEDYPLNAAAFQLLQADAVAKRRTAITGPVNFNTFYPYRLRTGEMPSWVQFDSEPVNPLYYPAFLQQLGFSVAETYESRLIPGKEMPAVYAGKQLLLHELTKIPYDFIPLNPVTWKDWEDELYGLIHAVFSQNPFYKAISRKEFGLLYNTSFAEKLCPHSSVLFKEKKSGRLAAISLCYPDYSTLQLRGAPCFERDYNKLCKKVLLAKSVGVHPDFRMQGLMNFMGAYGMRSFSTYYDEVLFCTMRSDNFSLHFTNGLAYEKAGYALYRKQLK